MKSSANLRLAIPSDGALYEPTLTFLRSCGISIHRPNLRRYTADIPALPGVTVLFQRTSDIPSKVEEGSADIGIVGYDRFLESRREGGNAKVVIDQLNFGNCELALGVPDSWIDVVSVADLSDLSVEFREEGRDLRVATKFPRLVERFLLANGVNYFSLAHSSGTLEIAPSMGFADVIADIVSSGTTMRENHLKTIDGGTILSSEACLISNRVSLAEDSSKLALAKNLVEVVEAHMQSQEYFSITANMKGETPEEVANLVLDRQEISGLLGPTISRVYTPGNEGWYAVTVIVERDNLLGAVAHMRSIGGTSVTVTQPTYVFQSACEATSRLV